MRDDARSHESLVLPTRSGTLQQHWQAYVDGSDDASTAAARGRTEGSPDSHWWQQPFADSAHGGLAVARFENSVWHAARLHLA